MAEESKIGALFKALLFVLALVGGFMFLMFLFARFMGAAPELDPVEIARGEIESIDVQFTGASSGASGGELKVPEKSAKWGIWSGYDFRELPSNKNDMHYEVMQEGETKGIYFALGEVEIKHGSGHGFIEVEVPEDAPPGTYKIYLEGVYMDYTDIGMTHTGSGVVRSKTKRIRAKGFVVTTAVVEVSD